VVQERANVVLVEAPGWVVSWTRTQRVTHRTYTFSVWSLYWRRWQTRRT
jgi:hypothetical protein